MEKRPIIVFAHGAGAPSSSAWMRRWAARLGEIGDVFSFDYPYMRAGRKAPDRMPALVAAHREAVSSARAAHGDSRPLVLAGKSMGSRVGCHLAAESPELAEALVCFGYPLRPAGGGPMRDEVLRALHTPILFVQGSRDPLCPLDDLAQVRPQMRARNELCLVDDGDHSIEVRKRVLAAQGRTQGQWDDEVLAAVRAFVSGSFGP